jgi:uncharacterized phage protein (TIGR02218 family)
MRDLPPALAAHLGEGVTTLCRCWRLTRTDGAVLGFTDHDRDLLFDGVVHAAATGLDAAEAAAELGFAVGGGDVAGALSAAGLTDEDIAAGLYDDATVETWLVNWASPDERVLLATASIGEIRRTGRLLRGRAARPDAPARRNARPRLPGGLLGRSRGRALPGRAGHAGLLATGSVDRSDGALGFATASLTDYADGWFTGGRLIWTSGANAGRTVEVKAHRRVGPGTEIDLWQRATRPILVGDAFRVSAGCDKSLATCRSKFGNVLNHRGFPHMPGNDFVLSVAGPGAAIFDGGSLFR